MDENKPNGIEASEQTAESKKKRKTTTSSAVKNRYNKKVYDSIIVRVPKELAQAFKEKCASEGIPQAQVLKKAMQDFLNS